MDSYVIDNKKLILVNSIDNIYIVFYIFSGVEIIAFKIFFFSFRWSTDRILISLNATIWSKYLQIRTMLQGEPKFLVRSKQENLLSGLCDTLYVLGCVGGGRQDLKTSGKTCGRRRSIAAEGGRLQRCSVSKNRICFHCCRHSVYLLLGQTYNCFVYRMSRL